MTFDEFKQLEAGGKLAIGIDESDAKKFINLLPKNCQYAVYFWAWMAILTIPLGIVVWYYYRWWAGIPVIVLLFPAIHRGNNKSVAQFVLDKAGKDKSFFDLLVASNVLVFRNTQQ